MKITNFISKRLAKKIDPFTAYALVASQLAIEDAKLQLNRIDLTRTGVFVGNSMGGWEFTDAELRKLHTLGVAEVSPFLATAWFAAAPQGQISILNGLKGYSKTLDSDKASGLTSIGYAARAISEGRADIIIAGGTEAAITPFMMAAFEADNNSMSLNGVWCPFDIKRHGWIAGEGAAFAVLETMESANNRGAEVYGEIVSFSNVNMGCYPQFLAAGCYGLERSMTEVLVHASVAASSIDVVMADGLGTTQGDAYEAQAIGGVIGNNVLVSSPKSMVGHLCGAAGAFDVALSAMSLRTQSVLPTINVGGVACDIKLVLKKTDANINNILVNSRGTGGISASLLLSKV